MYQLCTGWTKKAPGTIVFSRFPGNCLSFKLGKSMGVSKHFCLLFVLFMPTFHFNYTYYFDLLIFCCQNVAIYFLHILQNEKLLFHFSCNIFSKLRKTNSCASLVYKFTLYLFPYEFTLFSSIIPIAFPLSVTHL